MFENPRIDVHGLTSEEALTKVKINLPQFKNLGYHEVYIIHGKGQGILRQKIRAFLVNNPYVKKIRKGKDNEGGDGVTVAIFL